MTLHLFQGYGLELEYMIVDRNTLSVKPICDQILQKLAGTIVSEFEIDGVGISNELALHVLELKTAEPVPSIDEAILPLHRVAAMLNEELAAFDARLLPGGMHPWMDPAREMVLWPHEYHEVYQTYHRIFDCAKHGWINLQSIHLNLPFCGRQFTDRRRCPGGRSRCTSHRVSGKPAHRAFNCRTDRAGPGLYGR